MQSWEKHKSKYDREQWVRRRRHITVGEVEDMIELAIHEIYVDASRPKKKK